MRPVADPADGDDGDRNSWDKLRAQHGREAHHRGGDEYSPFGRNAATWVDQIKADHQRRAGEALGERMGVEIHQLEPDGVQETRYDGAGEAGDVAAPEEPADHRRKRYNTDQNRNTAETRRRRRSEHLPGRHKTRDQPRP